MTTIPIEIRSENGKLVGLLDSMDHVMRFASQNANRLKFAVMPPLDIGRATSKVCDVQIRVVELLFGCFASGSAAWLCLLCDDRDIDQLPQLKGFRTTKIASDPFEKHPAWAVAFARERFGGVRPVAIACHMEADD